MKAAWGPTVGGEVCGQGKLTTQTPQLRVCGPSAACEQHDVAADRVALHPFSHEQCHAERSVGTETLHGRGLKCFLFDLYGKGAPTPQAQGCNSQQRAAESCSCASAESRAFPGPQGW